jgi:hypothetical protein
MKGKKWSMHQPQCKLVFCAINQGFVTLAPQSSFIHYSKNSFFAALTFFLQSQEPRATHATDSSHTTLWIEAHASKIYFSSYVTISI